MRTQLHFTVDKFLPIGFFFLFLFFAPVILNATNQNPQIKNESPENFTEFKGKIVDRKSGAPLAFASLKIGGMNITTISNSEGEFSIKIPKEIADPKITVSFIGYRNKSVLLADLSKRLIASVSLFCSSTRVKQSLL